MANARRWMALLALLAAIVAAACSGDDQQQQEESPAVLAQAVMQQQEQQTTEQAEPAPEPEAEQQQDAPAQEEPEEPSEQEDVQEDEGLQISELAASAGLGEFIVGGDRPARLLVPGDWSAGGEPLPLAVLLHARASSAETLNWYLGGLHLHLNDGQFALLLPEGQSGSDGTTFWDATPACCEFTEVDSDDAGYLAALIKEAGALVDLNGVYMIGNSNGGFMAYRMACDGDVDDLRAVISIAGSSFETAEHCLDPSRVSVLQIHGTADDGVPYEGTRDLVNLANDDPASDGHPGAMELVERWDGRADCDLKKSQTLPAVDLDAAIDGNETNGLRFRYGCADQVTIDLWTLQGSGHTPEFHDLSAAILSWVQEVEQYRLTGESATLAPAGLFERPVGTRTRPARLYAPAGYSRAEAIPLVMVLHGFGGDADGIDAYLGLRRQIETERFALLMPDGRIDETGYRYWGSLPGSDGGDEDDVTYLADLFTEARGYLNVDGVYVIGYSNGGAMAYTLACAGPLIDDLRGLVAIAAPSFKDPSRCDNWRPVSVLHIHGDADDTILYAGVDNARDGDSDGESGKEGVAESDDGYPGAVELTQRWAVRAGCNADAIEQLDDIDLDIGIPGAETARQRVRQACNEYTIELWTIREGGHGPEFRDDIGGTLIRWLKENWSYIGK